MTTVFYSGAGLSAASGVPTFRGEGGLYFGIQAERILSVEGYREQPARVEGFHDRLWEKVVSASPNTAHVGIACWALQRKDTVVITQNVDDLLERCGCPGVIHLHGELARYRCRNNPKHVQPATRPWSDAIRCQECNARVRTDVVLFGEQAPEYQRLYDVIDALQPDDQFVVIGTFGNVVPIGELLDDAGCYLILNTLEASPFMDERVFDEVIYESAPTAWPRIAGLLDRQRARRELGRRLYG